MSKPRKPRRTVIPMPVRQRNFVEVSADERLELQKAVERHNQTQQQIATIQAADEAARNAFFATLFRIAAEHGVKPSEFELKGDFSGFIRKGTTGELEPPPPAADEDKPVVEAEDAGA